MQRRCTLSKWSWTHTLIVLWVKAFVTDSSSFKVNPKGVLSDVTFSSFLLRSFFATMFLLLQISSKCRFAEWNTCVKSKEGILCDALKLQPLPIYFVFHRNKNRFHFLDLTIQVKYPSIFWKHMASVQRNGQCRRTLSIFASVLPRQFIICNGSDSFFRALESAAWVEMDCVPWNWQRVFKYIF